MNKETAMPRRNLLTGDLAFVAEGRNDRPYDYNAEVADTSSEACPFCPQNGHLREKVLCVNANRRVMALNNLHPFFDTNYGRHEVIVDTNIHDERFINFNLENITEALKMLRSRYIDMAGEEGIKYVQVFKNNGRKAGASLRHSHWQMCSLRLVPPRVEAIYSNADAFYRENGKSYWQNELETHEELLIYHNDAFAAMVPYAPRFSHQVDIVPLADKITFDKTSDADLYELAKILKASLLALEDLCSPDFNILIINPPLGYNGKAGMLIQILPRFGQLAGFEQATGINVISFAPEESARRLRELVQKRYYECI